MYFHERIAIATKDVVDTATIINTENFMITTKQKYHPYEPNAWQTPLR